MAAAEKVLDAIEDAQEIIEETLDVIDAVPAWRCGLSRNQHAMQVVALLTIGGAIGGVAAYFIGKKRLSLKYDQLLQEEIAKTRQFYKHIRKDGDLDTPEKVVASRLGSSEVVDAASAISKYQGKHAPNTVVIETEHMNIFAQGGDDPNFDLAADMENRSPDVAYIITHEEFLKAEPGYEQEVLTYYAGDEILSGMDDEEIKGAAEMIGEETLLRFGHGSSDANTVYVRNDKKETDYEIVRSPGKYAHEVLGFEHGDETHLQKMRRREGRDE